MSNNLNTEFSPEDAQFREDVEAVFEEAGGLLTEDELIERVRHRELQRVVDGMVKDGLMMEVEKGALFPYEEGPRMGGPCEMRPRP